MLNWLMKNRDGIIITVVIGILLEIGKKYVLLVFALFSSLGVFGVDAVTNYVYRHSAAYSGATVSNYLMYFAVCIFCCVGLTTAVIPTIMEWRGRRKLKKIKVKILKKESGACPSEEEEAFEIHHDGSPMVKLRIVLALTSVFLYVYLLLGLVIPGNIYTQYERNMTAIRPYVEETEYYLLQSKWVCMENKADYSYIKETISRIKEENGLGSYEKGQLSY